MRSTRIIAISDTHDYCPEFVLESISDINPDIILHNGDVIKQETYDVYKSTVPGAHFSAVQGDHDELPHLSAKNIIHIQNTTIGQIHGDRPFQKERVSTFINPFLRRHYYYWNGFARDALAEFSEEIDVLVTGHLHVPFICCINGTLIINPGAIIANGRTHHLDVPTLAVLDVRSNGVETCFLSLQETKPPERIEVGQNGPLNYWSQMLRNEIKYQPLTRRVVNRSYE